MPEPDQFWHPNCWMLIDWHVEDGGGNPRPMSATEKSVYQQTNMRHADDQ